MQMDIKKTISYLVSLLMVVGVVAYLVMDAKQSNPLIEPLTESWEKVVPYQEIPQGLASLSAQECGVCHKDHYAEWKQSTHANAWTDLQFQSELKKESSPFFCINCHIPLENQQEYLVEGTIGGDIYQPVRTKNPRWDKNLQQEGITCAACHVRDNAIVGPTGSKKAPHKTIKDPGHLSESLCINCHNANAVITETLSCSFETGDEWREGPFKNSKNCIACHMEEVNRPLVAGYKARKSHYHFFAGSGIPKLSTQTTQMLNGLEFYPGELLTSYSTGEAIKYSFKAKNEHAGHRVPTGDPERFINIDFKIVNAKDEVVASKTERIGEKWEWYPKAKKLSDNNFEPKEERTYTFNAKDLKKGSHRLVVEVTKHRMNAETAKYNKLTDDYPLSVSAYRKEYSFSVR
jgi:nitrate reductase cytochrome c-type subunit